MKTTINNLFLAIALLISATSVGQSASSNYVLTESGAIGESGLGSWIDCTSGTVLSLGDDTEAAFNWPFDFRFYDNDYTSADQISVCSNGFIRLDDVASTNFQTARNYKLKANRTELGQIIALGIHDTDFSAEVSEAYYMVSGTAPARVLTIEFVNIEIDYNDNKYADIQLSLYEDTQDLVIRFGDDNIVKTGADLGFHSGVNGYFSELGKANELENNTYAVFHSTALSLDIINEHAANNTAITAPMTFAQLEAASANNLTILNIDAYRNSVNAEDAVESLSALQTLVDAANMNVINTFATNNTAASEFMSLTQLRVTEVEGLIPNYLANYRTAIDAETSINSLADLQTVIDGVNTTETSNDNFANAFEVNSCHYIASVNNLSFSKEDNEPTVCRSNANNTMWFVINPTNDSEVLFSAGGADRVISLWSGTALDNLTSEISCQDSDNYTYDENTLGESFTYTLTAGQQYYFRVEPFDNGGEGATHIEIKGAGIETVWDGNEWSTGEEPQTTEDVVIDSDLTISNGLEVNDLRIETGTKVIVASGETLTVNGKVIVEAGAELVNTGGDLYVTGTDSEVTTMSLSANEYSYVSSPINGATLESLSNPHDLYHFDEANSNWVYYDGANLNGAGDFVNARGYAVNYNSNTPITITGVLNDGDISIDVSNTGTYDGGGWNLIGNPYPSAINANDFLAANDDLIGHSVYLWDATDYVTHNGVFGVNPTGGDSPSGRIGVGQGFFVRKSSAGTAPVQFTNSMRVDNGQFYRASEAKMIRVKLSNGEDLNNAFEIHMNEDATMGMDETWDMEKLKGNPEIAFYSVLGNHNLILQSIPQVEETVVLPIGFELGANGSYAIELEKMQALGDDVQLWLIDAEKGTETALTIGERYEFNGMEGTQNDRFAIKMTKGQRQASPTSVAHVNTYVANNTLFVSNSSEERVEAIDLYDMSGRVVLSTQNTNGNFTSQVQIESLPAGVYVVRANMSNQQVVSQQIVIQ